MMLQLNPTIPVTTPKGPGQAILVIDYGSEHHLLWVVFQDETGECWTWPNPEVRAQKNVTMGRKLEPEKKPRITLEGLKIDFNSVDSFSNFSTVMKEKGIDFFVCEFNYC